MTAPSKHRRAHTDEAAILHGAGMDDGSMPDGHVVAEDAGEALPVDVQDRAVLNIRPLRRCG